MATSAKAALTKKENIEPVRSDSTEKKPYMSEYDKNVEERLQSLESRAHTPCKTGSVNITDNDALAALEAKVDDLIARLSAKMSF
jgi:hypothetical protein